MTEQWVAARFGQDAPARIAASTSLLLEASDVPPEDMIVPLIPFLPITGSGVGTSLTGGAVSQWRNYPGRCDLTFAQGDDIVIPLYFQDPVDVDMSSAADWLWYAQIRTRHSIRAMLLNSFSISATYAPAVAPATIGITTVELFLARAFNVFRGIFEWELYSISPADFERFPVPDDVPVENWPPLDTLRTWLYGKATIIPRGTTTDVLPLPYVYPNWSAFPATVEGGGWVGPNGRVP